MAKITRTNVEATDPEVTELNTGIQRVVITPKDNYQASNRMTVKRLISLLLEKPMDAPVWIMDIDLGHAKTITYGPHDDAFASGAEAFIKTAQGGEVVLGVSKYKNLPARIPLQCEQYHYVGYGKSPAFDKTTHSLACHEADPYKHHEGAKVTEVKDYGVN